MLEQAIRQTFEKLAEINQIHLKRFRFQNFVLVWNVGHLTDFPEFPQTHV